MKKGENLAVSIPGAACHVDMTFSALVDRVMIEPWAIETMLRDMEEKVSNIKTRLLSEDKQRFADLERSVLRGRKGWDRLIGLEALINKCE